MPDVQSLIESAEARGLRLFLAEGEVKVQAPQALDGDTKALIEELKEHKAEILEALATVEEHPLRARVVERVHGADGTLRAVLICSDLLEDHLWLILDRTFAPMDSLAQYYPEELPLLKDKTPEELRQIHMAKLEFRGPRVVQGRIK